MGNIDFHHLQCCCLGIVHIFGELVVTSPRELVEIPRTYVRFTLSFPEEDLCPVHDFSWSSLGRNAVGRQMRLVLWRETG